MSKAAKRVSNWAEPLVDYLAVLSADKMAGYLVVLTAASRVATKARLTAGHWAGCSAVMTA